MNYQILWKKAIEDSYEGTNLVYDRKDLKKFFEELGVKFEL